MAGTQDYTTVIVKGHNYRVGYIRADIGALLVRKIMSAIGGDRSKATKVLMGGLSTEDELLMQKELLSVVAFERQVGESVNYLPIFDGERIFDPGLKTDVVSLWGLEQVSFDQNIAPFFNESGQKDVGEILSQLLPPPSNSETSMDTSGVQL
jgi:hypothetical protein